MTVCFLYGVPLKFASLFQKWSLFDNVLIKILTRKQPKKSKINKKNEEDINETLEKHI